MPSASPLSPGIDLSKDRYLSLSIPDEPTEEKKEHNRLLAQSLQQSWDKAQARFKKETGEDLGNFRSTKNGILGTLKQHYGGDNQEVRRRDDILKTVELILNGIEVVAATTVKGASMVFGPAELCYNAFSILFNIPRAIKKYGEDLQLLFKEVSGYLNNFRIFDRIDRRRALDTALLISNNEILIALVDICMLAWKVMKNPIRTVLGNAFLRNDAIGAALAAFHDLIDTQNRLTSTVTLESVLKSESLSREIREGTTRIEDTTKDTNTIVKSLAADSADSKNMKVDRDRILKIDRTLDLNEATVITPLDQLRSGKTPLLEDMIVLLENNPDYREWRASTARRRLLYIGGETGSGKTTVLSALAQQIEDEKNKLHALQRASSKETRAKDERSIYLTYHPFSHVGSAENRGKFDTPIHTALKVMAAQLARQSTRYASTLNDALKDIQKGQKTLEELWQALKFGDFNAPTGSVLFMFFDGLDQLKFSLQELRKTLRVSAPRRQQRYEDEMLKLRLIFTGRPDDNQKLATEKLSIINIGDINGPLIRSFVESQLQNLNIFQDDDDDSKTQKERVLQIIPESSGGSFGIAMQKIRMLEEAIEEDVDPEMLMRDLKLVSFNTLADEGRKILEKLSRSTDLSVQHGEQLRELLMWSVYAKRRPRLDELEAALYLQRDKKSLEPLKRKVEGRFEEVLGIIDSTVYPRDPIEEAITLSTPLSKPYDRDWTPPQVTINISAGDANERSLRNFLTELGTKFADVRFGISSQTGRVSETNRLAFAQSDAEYTIVSRLLRALNDDRVRRQTVALVKYATVHLPAHLDTFQARSLESVSLDELKTVGSALVSFLWDSESIGSAWDLHAFDPQGWLSDVNVGAARIILEDGRLQNQLDPIQRRWAVKQTSEATGRLGFLGVMAHTAAYKWLVDRSGGVDAKDCFGFVEGYLDLLERSGVTAIGTGGEGVTDGVVNAHNASRPETQQADSASNSDSGTDTDGDETSSDVDQQPVPTERVEPLLGNFSTSSVDIVLVKKSILKATCYNSDGRPNRSSINLNACLSNNWGKLRWKLNGNAFASAYGTDLSEDGKVLKLLLGDGKGGRHWRSVRLDEQITNDEGRLVFLDCAYQGGSDSVGDSGESEAQPAFVERVTRAEKWALREVKTQPESFALVRIGYTLLHDDADAAIDYFNRAAPEPLDTRRAIGLSLAYAQKDDFRNALESLQPALTMFRNEKSNAGKTDDIEAAKADPNEANEVKDLFTCLIRAAQYHMALEEAPAAIDLLEEALTRRPWASDTRCQLIELLCRNDLHPRAEELFAAWVAHSKDPKVESPSAFFLRKLDSDAFLIEFYAAVASTKSAKVRSGIIETIEIAIEEADMSHREGETIRLLHFRGLFLAHDRSEAGLESACQSWVEAIRIGRDLESPDDFTMYWSSRLAAMYKFDQARKRLDTLVNKTGPEAETLLNKLADDIGQLITPFHRDLKETNKPTTYVAVFARLIGRFDLAKLGLKPNMAEALDMLTDGDVHNDAFATDLLFETFLNYGDIEGALTTWSLFDRLETRARIKQAPPDEENLHLEPKSHPSGGEEDDEDEDEISKYLEVWCDGCDKELPSWEQDLEQWWCSYCPETTFCGPCKEKLQQNRLLRHVCNPGHDLVLMQHASAGYTKEDIKGTNVRIDWKLETVPTEDEKGEDQKTLVRRRRVGGRIVELKEWLDILRKEWDVKETRSEGKVQL